MSVVDTELRRHHAEISQVERHNRHSPPIDRRFEHKFVSRIAQLRPPNEMRLDGLDHRKYGIDEDGDIVEAEAGGQAVLGNLAGSLPLILLRLRGREGWRHASGPARLPYFSSVFL